MELWVVSLLMGGVQRSYIGGCGGLVNFAPPTRAKTQGGGTNG